MTRRADHVDATRRRITEAAVRLHGSVGPAATTVSAIADEAGVTRLTVYRHFPDDEALLAACSMHWLGTIRTVPDPAAWRSEADPERRLRAALRQLYAFYREGQDMLLRVHRDLASLPEAHVRAMVEQQAALVAAVLEAWPPAQRTPSRRALAGHAMAFGTWHSLCATEGLSNAAAVRAMVRLVAG